MSRLAAVAALSILGPVPPLVYVAIRSLRPPSNRPERFRPEARLPNERVVVCAGDSITHGSVSFDYVAALERSLGPEGFRFVNGGINADLAWNLAQRLDAIIACDPDVVTLLIGSNDAMGSANPSMARGQVTAKGLPQRASFEWYESNLREIVARLRSETRARIVLITLPILGDELDSEIHAAAKRGSAIIERVAKDNGLSVLDLGRALEAEQRAARHVAQKGFHLSARSLWWSVRAPLLRYLTNASFDRISDGIGLLFTTDFVHLNERGGAVLVALLEKYLRSFATQPVRRSTNADAN